MLFLIFIFLFFIHVWRSRKPSCQTFFGLVSWWRRRHICTPRAFRSNFSHDHDHLNFPSVSGGMSGKGHLVKVAGLTLKSMGLYSRLLLFFFYFFTVHGSLITWTNRVFFFEKRLHDNRSFEEDQNCNFKDFHRIFRDKIAL